MNLGTKGKKDDNNNKNNNNNNLDDEESDYEDDDLEIHEEAETVDGEPKVTPYI